MPAGLSFIRCVQIRPFWAALLAIVFAGLWAVPSEAQDSYRLNPGDRIALRFVQWDTIKLDFVEFDVLNGTYSVEPDGTIMVPVIGLVDVEGKNLTEIADAMAVHLQNRLGLVEPPGVSLSIVGYRPVYVSGAVTRPGAYDFSPGLTVQQAMALAGGLNTVLAERLDGASAAIRISGSLREVSIDMARQEVRAARLRAEMDGGTGFEIAEGVTHPDGQDRLNAIVDHERVLLESRREAQIRALDALDESRALLETEISALEEKLAGQTRQVDLLRESVGNMETLFERGLVRSPNLVSLQGQLISLENHQLDTETAIFRARQTISELERDRIDIQAARRLEILRELQTSEAMIERLQAQRSTNRQLLLGAEALLAATTLDPDIRIEYRITRQGPDGTQTLDASLDSRLSPADVLDVKAFTEFED
tara:strand:- start:147 stop:1415 length:1269 start_codon:yes stop_codon:yes gene_type:complete